MNSIMRKAVAESRKPTDEFGKPRFFKSISNYFKYKKAHANGGLDLPQRLEITKPTFATHMIKSPKTRISHETLYEQIPRTLRATYTDGSESRVVLEKGTHPALFRVWADSVHAKYLYTKFFKLKVKIDDHTERAEKADNGAFRQIRQFWNVFWTQRHEAELLFQDFKMRKKARTISDRYNIENTESNLRIFALRHGPRFDSVEVLPHSIVVRSSSISYVAGKTVTAIFHFAGSLWNAAALKKEINFSTAPLPDNETQDKMNELLTGASLFSVGRYSKRFPKKPMTLQPGELTYDPLYDTIGARLTNQILKIERKL